MSKRYQSTLILGRGLIPSNPAGDGCRGRHLGHGLVRHVRRRRTLERPQRGQHLDEVADRETLGCSAPTNRGALIDTMFV